MGLKNITVVVDSKVAVTDIVTMRLHTLKVRSHSSKRK